MSRTALWSSAILGMTGLILIGWMLVAPGRPGATASPPRLEPRAEPAPAEHVTAQAPRPIERARPLIEPADPRGISALDLARQRRAEEDFTGIVGTITASGEPVARVRVTATWPEHLRSVWTDANGRFVLRHLPPGPTTLTTDPGHEAPTTHRDVAVQSGRVTTVRVTLDATELCGVLLTDSETPLGGLSIWLFDEAHRRVAWETTDDGGAFRFRYLAPGRYRARVNGWRHHADHAPVVRPTWSMPVRVSVLGPTRTMEIHVERGGRIHATVFEPDGDPAPRQTEVWLLRLEGGVGLQGEALGLDPDGRLVAHSQPYDRVAWSDKQGVVNFHGLAAGDYALLAEPTSMDEVQRSGVRVRVDADGEPARVTLGVRELEFGAR